ncbi:uncharacterized protein An18g02040 [Aspergillus niger]|uniref:Contig An18c0050, genomic contig n=2 Tax=Aspergillus niger TaxID=5061 RepID=A2RA61_ASPNC|nr:uncharacterized protein An18g02040 [Aspergillus niger]CAK47276.1 unnamed protein product [Aspergillus niger]
MPGEDYMIYVIGRLLVSTHWNVISYGICSQAAMKRYTSSARALQTTATHQPNSHFK